VWCWFLNYFLRQSQQIIQSFALEKLAAGWVCQDAIGHKLLEDLTVVNLFLNCFFTHEPIDVYVSCLADAESALGCLDVYHGIPVRVQDNHFVSSGEVDAKSPNSCRKQENLQIFSLHFIELLNRIHPCFQRYIAIHPTELNPLISKNQFKQVKHSLGLTENQNFVSSLFTVPVHQKFDQNGEFPGLSPFFEDKRGFCLSGEFIDVCSDRQLVCLALKLLQELAIGRQLI
jgi:hypothetical protein